MLFDKLFARRVEKSKVPVFPGQIWVVPQVGAVFITRADERYIEYFILENNVYETGDSHVCVREDFAAYSYIVSKPLEDNQENRHGGDEKVIQLKRKNQNFYNGDDS
jgi:hypothetical protein